MIYLSQMLGKPVLDADGADIGTISDVAIATGEVFPRVTSLAFKGPDKTPFMLSWRKFVGVFDGEAIHLNVPGKDLRFSYLQPDEILLHRDLLNQQIVDTQGMKVVRVNDLKLSESRNQLRLLGAEVGMRGLLRAISPGLERLADVLMRTFGGSLPENLIAWNYMDLLERDLSHVQLSVTHKRLHELHPADVADILEKLSATQRAKVFEHLDNNQAAETISELEDEFQADVIDDLGNQRASDILEMMDPDDAADVIGDLPYDKAEMLLRLMGVREARAIRSLLGYKEKTAGGIMTPEVTTVTEEMTVQQVIEFLRGEAAEHESIYYIYVVEGDRRLVGVISLRDLIMSNPETCVCDLVSRELITVDADDDQEDVAETMSKYDLLALPVIDESGKLLGIVTVDDALDVLEEESAEDLALVSGGMRIEAETVRGWLGNSLNWLSAWVFLGLAAGAGLWFYSRYESVYLVASLFIPLMIQLADEVASHSFARLLGGEDDDAAPAWRRLRIDIGAGLALGIVSSLVALALLQVVRADARTSAALCLSIFATVLILTVAGATLLPYSRRPDGSWRFSGSVIDALMKTAAIAVYLGLIVLSLEAVRG